MRANRQNNFLLFSCSQINAFKGGQVCIGDIICIILILDVNLQNLLCGSLSVVANLNRNLDAVQSAGRTEIIAAAKGSLSRLHRLS